MSRQKEARQDAPTSERAKMGAETEQATTSMSNDTTDRPVGQAVHIADILSHGADRGLTIGDLQRLTDLDPRTIRLMIRHERMNGALIISDNKSGYFLTDDPAEAQRFARSMRCRAREIAAVAAAIERVAGLD